MCEISVCSGCSPSKIQLEGFEGMQRVCTPCIANVARVPAAHSRLVRLGGQLDALCGNFTDSSSLSAKCTNLEEALDFSESALVPLEGLWDHLRAEQMHAERLHAAVEAQSNRLVAEKVRVADEKARSERLERALEETEKRVRAQLEQELQATMKLSSKCPKADSICSTYESLGCSEKHSDDEVTQKEGKPEEQEEGEEAYYNYLYCY